MVCPAKQIHPLEHLAKKGGSALPMHHVVLVKIISFFLTPFPDSLTIKEWTRKKSEDHHIKCEKKKANNLLYMIFRYEWKCI